jgi:hypothetical protein
MNEHGKSDGPAVPLKSPNNAGQPAAEEMEGRGPAKGNPLKQNAPRTQCREGAPSALERVRLAAARDRRMQFTALLHHIYDLTTLRTAYLALKREQLEDNLHDLVERLKRDTNRARPVPAENPIAGTSWR